MNPMMPSFDLLRRAVRAAALAIIAAVALAGCAGQPTSAPAPTLAASLAKLGFERTDDGYVLNLPGALLFETGSDVVSADAKLRLQRLVSDLRALDITRLRLFGHTDNVGTAEFNAALSLRRAEAVAAVMIDAGFPAAGMELRGFGFERPLVDNATADGRARNRRVAVIVPFD